MNKRKQNNENINQSFTVPAIERAIKLAREIYLIEKNFTVILVVIASIFSILVLNILTIRNLISVSNGPVYTFVIFSSIISATVLTFMLILFIRSRNYIEYWADSLEQNAIKANISITMANKSKEEAVKAVAEAIDQIGEPLRKYISSKENFNEFIDVVIDKDLIFDVLIDAERVQNAPIIGYKSNNRENIELQNVLRTYGSVIIKIVDGTIDQETVKSFSTMPSKYESITKNKVGLTVIIGERVSPKAYNMVRQNKHNYLNSIMLIEK